MAYYILKSYKLTFDSFRVFQALKHEKNCFFLDSSLNSLILGRYSFLGVDPFYILATKNQDPIPKLKKIFQEYKISLPKNNLPFLGGAVGYLGYDLGFILEKKIKSKPKPDLGIPDSLFGFYNTIIIIDRLKKILSIICVGFPEKKDHFAKLLCEENFKKALNFFSFLSTPKIDNRKYKIKESTQELKSNFIKEDYLRAVRKAKEYIRAGDIYQVNLSQRFEAKTTLSSFEIYRRLREISPACFSAYLDCQDFQILSSSPERFLNVKKDLVATRPMKGTCARSSNKKKDTCLKKQLLGSLKDKAELIMIVDLERNDLGKVCSYDSIRVTKLRELEKYNTVYQTTATVEGRLFKNKDRLDLLRACFPGGSITGCPKIRAMEIIDELEPDRRLIYTGALGYLSFSGDMDFNILIRTILKKDERLYFGVGGGIVADSCPEKEYQETLVKAKAMIKAINLKSNDILWS
jgi:para-aminobenzoate synthetase component 1